MHDQESCIKKHEKSHDDLLYDKVVQLKKKLGFLGVLNIVMHLKVSHEKAVEIHDRINKK